MNFKKLFKKYYWIVPFAVLGMFCLFLLFGQKQKNTEIENEQLFSNQEKKSYSKVESKEQKRPTKQFVEIKGAVVKPGLYPIGNNTRLAEILQQAGGATAEADLKSVNLAQLVHDQDSFYIPNNGEASVNPVASANTTSSTPAQSNEGLVDINTADVAKLQTLNGVGAKKAEKIVQYRTEKGNFKQIEDLKNVSGIGDKIYETLKDQITVSP